MVRKISSPQKRTFFLLLRKVWYVLNSHNFREAMDSLEISITHLSVNFPKMLKVICGVTIRIVFLFSIHIFGYIYHIHLILMLLYCTICISFLLCLVNLPIKQQFPSIKNNENLIKIYDSFLSLQSGTGRNLRPVCKLICYRYGKRNCNNTE